MKKSRRLVNQYRQTINGTKEEILLLLCPERETKWLHGWQYEMIYSQSGCAEKGCTFETDNDFGKYQWVMTRYESFTVQFVKFIKDKMIVIIDIILIDKDEHSIYTDITYTYTAIDDSYIDTMHAENNKALFDDHMRLWQDSMNHYISTGDILKR